jgi:hypothetical protein
MARARTLRQRIVNDWNIGRKIGSRLRVSIPL